MSETFLFGARFLRSGNRKSKIQNPKSVGFLAIVFTLAFGVGALAQQQAKIPKIGYLAAGSVRCH